MRMAPGIRGDLGRVGECPGEVGRFQHTRACHVPRALDSFVRLDKRWWATWCEHILGVLPCVVRARVRNSH